ncbi:PaaI family thioesterase [Erythrobacter sp. LQ02-29]|uniref:PaaI family thioesterase n=1 Tax=Erythrobacter sp. LQ02-29 TaxID=2920384 RepID=UPI001F4E0CEC|nr:PaaI family thioesterase [Erythrobacter sp. LQ02-29]
MSGPRLQITEGEFAGWERSDSDDFERYSGPYYERAEADGRRRIAFRAEARHMNGHGVMHGGCLMTFADAALFTISHDARAGQRGVTLQLAGDFLEPVPEGAWVEATGEVVRGGGKTIFVRGMVTADGTAALSFNGIVRKIGDPR